MVTRNLTDQLHNIVASKWPEIASFAFENCADGYDRGYVLLIGPDAEPTYVSVPNRKETMSETMEPWTLEEAVLARENCEDFIVVALQDGESLVWGMFQEIDGVSMREAAGVNPRRT